MSVHSIKWMGSLAIIDSLGGIIPMPRPAGIPRPGPTGSYLKEVSAKKDQITRMAYTYSIFFIIIHDWRWSFDTYTDHSFASQDNKSQGPFHLLLGRCLFSNFFFGPDSSKLFTICQYQVHMPIKRQHLASQCATIVNRNFQSPVDETEHLSTFRFWRRLFSFPWSVR